MICICIHYYISTWLAETICLKEKLTMVPRPFRPSRRPAGRRRRVPARLVSPGKAPDSDMARRTLAACRNQRRSAAEWAPDGRECPRGGKAFLPGADDGSNVPLPLERTCLPGRQFTRGEDMSYACARTGRQPAEYYRQPFRARSECRFWRARDENRPKLAARAAPYFLDALALLRIKAGGLLLAGSFPNNY